jgi:hypothetical protein
MGGVLSTDRKITFNIINDKKYALELLNTSEKIDLYIDEVLNDTSNFISRKNTSYSPNPPNMSDYNKATNFLQHIHHKIPKRLHMDLDTINIIQLMPTADGGMPHTRPDNIICYPDLSQLYSIITLKHELWHIHQKKYAEYWEQIFNKLGWKEWTGNLPPLLENNRRYNPDTIDSPLWIYRDTWVTVPVFNNITQPKVNDVQIWFYNPEKGYHTRQIPDEFLTYYTNLNGVSLEHPREITAYMLSEHERFKDTPAFKFLIELLGNTAIISEAQDYM